ncbi:RNA polymerase sigma-70 factor [Sinomicrobium kalidii]|uniref:RNA polymerase sigma-70 factor n=1 Tax=Sinomicrobium kalidii TaxID=2900738 RepID=UPI001E4FFA50|nr:RNA polymerase sigma-70 factor [Sinomicrobium kalidii]UGU15441.1 RNA polymerase sigma-70 factor [Sinomicrobium kalidii]
MSNTKADINSDSFKQLLENNSSGAFELLFKLYYDKLYHIAKSYVRNEQDAEEIVQDVFLKMWERRNNKEVWTNNFLYTITKNACLNYLKHQKVVVERARNYYDKQLSDPLRFITNEAASRLMEEELEQKIRESMAALPEKRRAVFVKSRVEGMKSQEIARQLGISKRTVDTHIYMALKHMRFQLKEFFSVFF